MVTILTRGDPLLARPSRPVDWPDAQLPDDIRTLRTALQDFRRAQGFGRAIAAPQVGISKRIVYLHVAELAGAMLNPQITWRSADRFALWDDCLSVPDCIVRVMRHCSISLDFLDELGRRQHWERVPAHLSELLQHELDHLDGVLMTDRAIDADSIRPVTERAALIDAVRSADQPATVASEGLTRES